MAINFFKQEGYDLIRYMYHIHEVSCQKFSCGWRVNYWYGRELKERHDNIKSKEEALQKANEIMEKIDND